MTAAIVIVADMHAGSHAGLCPPDGFELENGGVYKPNPMQLYTWLAWTHFWTRFVPGQTSDCSTVAIAINGDVVEGVHHRLTGIITTDVETQERAALKVLDSIKTLWPQYNYIPLFMTRGTEVHSDSNAISEERIAKTIGAERNDIGEYTSWQWWINLDGAVINLAHHIGRGRNALENEIDTALKESAKNGQAMPDVIGRSHVHRFDYRQVTRLNNKHILAFTTPCWQLRTPNVEHMDRLTLPHIGGVVLRMENNKQCTLWEKLYQLPMPVPHKIN